MYPPLRARADTNPVVCTFSFLSLCLCYLRPLLLLSLYFFVILSSVSLSSPLSHYNSFSLTLNLPLSLSFTLGLFALRPLLISFISLSSLPSSSHSLPPYRLILLPPDLPPLPPINMDTHEVNDDIVVAFNEVLEVSHCERHRMLPVLVRQLRPIRCMQS